MYAELIGDKQCSRCRAVKPLAAFTIGRGTCKPCRSELQIARNHRDLPTSGRKWCASCQVEHPTAEFNRNRSQPDGLHKVCREAQNRDQRLYEFRQRPEVRAMRLLQHTHMPAEPGPLVASLGLVCAPFALRMAA